LRFACSSFELGFFASLPPRVNANQLPCVLSRFLVPLRVNPKPTFAQDLVDRLSGAVAAAQAQALLDPKPTGSPSHALPYQEGDDADAADAEYASAAALMREYEQATGAFAPAVPPPAPAKLAARSPASLAAASSSEGAVTSETISSSRPSSSSRGGSATAAVETELIAAVRDSVRIHSPSLLLGFQSGWL
jgi:hypothetical protein